MRKSPATVRKLAYQTFVRPQLEFASSVWSPHQNYLVDMLESIKNRASRFITSNYDRTCSVTKIKADIALQPLGTRRTISLLCLFHRYVHGNRPHVLPLEVPARTSRRLNNSHSFMHLFGNTLSFNASALPRVITVWNSLPDNIVCLTNREAFREELQSFLQKHCIRMLLTGFPSLFFILVFLYFLCLRVY